MSDETNPAETLRGSLAEMRAELDGMIGQEIARLLAAPDARGAPVAPEAASFDPRPRYAGPARGRAAKHAVDRPPQPAAASSTAREPIEGAGRPDDSGMRLDALARRLEGRLLRPRVRVAEPKAPAQEGDPSEGPHDGLDFPQSGGA